MRNTLIREAIAEIQGRLSELTAEVSKQQAVLSSLEDAQEAAEGESKHRVARKKKGKGGRKAGVPSWSDVLRKVLKHGPIARHELIDMLMAERGAGTRGAATQAISVGLGQGVLAYGADGKVFLK